jgi:tRNA(Ile)-lysidine synthase
VEDASNADPARTRSFIRARVMPALASLRPGVIPAIARSAAHAADAAELADALARIDAAACAAAERLDVARLLALPPARARNVLRFRVATLAGSPVEGAALDELLRQLASRRPGATVEVALGPAVARRYAGEVWIERAHPTPAPAGFTAEWTGETCWDLPALGGRLLFEPAHGEGLREAALRDGVEVRLRRGGERLRPRASGPRRALKDLLQEARVPPWRRSALPLVYCGGELAWVPHAGSDARFAAAPGERGRRLVWDAPR